MNPRFSLVRKYYGTRGNNARGLIQSGPHSEWPHSLIRDSALILLNEGYRAARSDDLRRSTPAKGR